MSETNGAIDRVYIKSCPCNDSHKFAYYKDGHPVRRCSVCLKDWLDVTERYNLDVRREEKARQINEQLGIQSNCEVSAGGKTGPYRLTISFLNERELLELIPKVQALLGERP